MEPESNGSGKDPEIDRSPSLAGRIVGAGAHGARRVAGATGIDQAIETAAEEAIVRAVESEAVERSITRILNGPVVENAVRDAMNSEAVERSVSQVINGPLVANAVQEAIDSDVVEAAISQVLNGPLIENAVQDAMKSEAVEQALTELVDSDLVDRIWKRVLDSDETQRLIERIADAPEIRAAIASQGMGLVDDVGRGVSRVTRVLDFIAERISRRILFRSQRENATDRAGVITRALALALDAVILNVVVVSGTALFGLLAATLGLSTGEIDTAAFAVGGVMWLSLASLYLFTFWSISGQTPGMRFLDIRVEHEGRPAIGPRLAFRRLIGFWLSAIPVCLGFIGVMIRLDRRGFHDRLGKTDVYYIDEAKPNHPHLDPVINPMEEVHAAPEPNESPSGTENAVDSD